MKLQSIRWGMLGTAGISRKNWEAIRLTGNGVVHGVASRDPERAGQFIGECQARAPFDLPPRVFGSYEELIASPEIDAVYIPLPTGLRKEWVIRAAHAGKPVLCEKPCAASLADLREMLAACQENNVLFMDGVMFMHSARLPAMRAILDDGEAMGRLRRVTSTFSFNTSPDFLSKDIRLHSVLEPHGCLGDLGWYCIRLALWCAGGALPRAVTGQLLAQASRPDSPGLVPTAFSGELIFDHGLSSSFFCSFGAGNYQWARLDGEKGTLGLNDFVGPFGQSREVEFFHNGQRVPVAECSVPHPTSQATKLFRAFADLVQRGATPAEWPGIALKTQQVMEAALQSALANGIPKEPGLL